ncbi:phage portal protein [Facklamia sp. P13064]|uniref:phage portal protein n=1 Tax=Facklamia sp. P13064 TaxID=3421953 RepID=UPI003D16AF54
MFEKLKSLIRKVGVTIGLVSEIKSVEDHKDLVIDEKAYSRIKQNKSIYSGFFEDWHKLKYRNSNGDIKTRNMVTLNVAKVMAQRMASLIFNEKVIIDVTSRGKPPENEEDKAHEFIKQTLKANGFHKNFQRYYEYCMALGGMAIKVYEHNGKVKLAWASADTFFPLSNDSDVIDEAVFINEETKDGKYYTLLEWNEWEGNNYVVRNELYESKDSKKLGVKIPLNTLYEGLDERTVIQGLSRPLFIYIKPNIANNKDLTSPLGISLYENSYDTLYFIDYLYDFFMNEFKLGKRRITVDPTMLKGIAKYDNRGQTVGFEKVFDTEETVFTPIGKADEGIKDLSVSLRSQDIIDSINANLELLSMQAGLSPGTFTFDGKSVKTATEVVSENSLTYQTKNSHGTLVEEGINELVTTILEVAYLCDIYDGDLEVDVSVDFDDSIAQDRNQNYRYYSSATIDGLMPKAEAIQRIFNVNEDTANEWLKIINQEKSRPMIRSEQVDMLNLSPLNME